MADIFVRDLATKKTTRVSVTSHKTQTKCAVQSCESAEPVLNAHKRYVTFESSTTNLIPNNTNKLADVFVHNHRTGKTQRVSVTSTNKQNGRDKTNNGNNAPKINTNNHFVVFHSTNSN